MYKKLFYLRILHVKCQIRIKFINIYRKLDIFNLELYYFYNENGSKFL